MTSELLKRDQQVIWHPFSPLKGGFPLIEVTRASGSLLYDANGRAYIDAISSWWATLHGHCLPAVTEAVSRQAAKLDHVLFAGCTHEPAVLLAEALAPLVPVDEPRFFFSDDGSTALEAAMKLALKYWSNRGDERRGIVALERGYHGDTFGAMSASARGIFSSAFDSHMLDVAFLDAELPESELADRAEAVFSQGAAFFVYEPIVQGVAGMRMHSARTLSMLLEIAARHGVVTIADEVMTGFGRTGPLFASTLADRRPDILCLSKGLSGGTLPIALTVVGDRVRREFDGDDSTRTFFHGHTFTANPIACAAAVASVAIATTSECADRRAAIERAHRSFAARAESFERLHSPRITGTIFACELGSPEGYLSNVRERIYRTALDRGVLLRPLGNTIYIMPPYCISDEELRTVYSVIEELAG